MWTLMLLLIFVVVFIPVSKSCGNTCVCPSGCPFSYRVMYFFVNDFLCTAVAATATTTKPLQLQAQRQPALFMRARCAWKPSQQLCHLYACLRDFMERRRTQLRVILQLPSRQSIKLSRTPHAKLRWLLCCVITLCQRVTRTTLW